MGVVGVIRNTFFCHFAAPDIFDVLLQGVNVGQPQKFLNLLQSKYILVLAFVDYILKALNSMS